jgi:hypothetical protein
MPFYKSTIPQKVNAANELLEWRSILDAYSIRRLVQFLPSASQRAHRLRRSNPIFSLLSKAERKQLKEDLENKTGKLSSETTAAG